MRGNSRLGTPIIRGRNLLVRKHLDHFRETRWITNIGDYLEMLGLAYLL
jgi:hypothetical protein